jgi:hypothetical protein
MFDHKLGPEIAGTALICGSNGICEATSPAGDGGGRVPTFGIMLYSWSMILSENRFPLFGIMLWPYSRISPMGSDDWACRRAV